MDCYRFSVRTFPGIVLVIAFLTSAASAQTSDATVVGTVWDSSGAVVANASIEAINNATNLKLSSTANSDGGYRIGNLPSGSWKVTAQATGFNSVTIDPVTVDAGRAATLNFTLPVGPVATAVTVSGAAPIIHTTTAAIGHSFSQRESRDLPVTALGIGVINLSLLNAGVASNGGMSVGTGPSVGGQRPRNNNFTIEGIDNNYKSVTGALLTVPNDAVEEFTLLQNQFSAEFGHSSGGQFNLIIRSGTNDFHGSAYEYFENRNLNATDQIFTNSGTTIKPRFDQNRYGGTFGGPLKRNRIFFFGNYEYVALGQSTTPGNILTPTQKGYATLAGISGLNPRNLSILKNYAAPASAPLSDPLRFPLVAGVPIEVGQLGISTPNYRNEYSGVASVDYNASSHDQLRGRYVYNRVISLDHKASLPIFFQIQPIDYALASLAEYHEFTPGLTNELRLGFNRFISDTPAGNYQFPGLDSFPNLQFADLGGLALGPDTFAPQSASQNVYQLTDNVSWARGRHTLKFGFDGRRVIAPNRFAQYGRGDYIYSKLDLFLRDITPDQFAYRTLGNPTFYGNDWSLFGFANDTWRYRPNLTINLGVRYEYTSVPFSDRYQALNAVSSVPGLIEFRAPQAQTKNFAPRVGLAWSPGRTGRTSVRAGFGMAYDVLYDNIGVTSLPPQFTTTVDQTGAGAAGFLARGGILPVAISAALTPAAARAATAAYIPDQKLPYSIQWNIGIEQVFAKDYTLEVRYLGTRGIHLPVQTRINRASPLTDTHSLPTYLTAPSQSTLDALPLTLNDLQAASSFVPAFAAAGFTGAAITDVAPIGNSTYHGLATQLNRRFAAGLQFSAAWTWSHLIDDSTADFFTTVLTPRRPQDFQNLRNERSSSALDHRQRFTLAAIYEVPVFRHSSGLMKNLLGGWSASPIYTYESPEYVTALSQTDSNLNGDVFADRTVVNLAGQTGVGSGVTALRNSRGQVVAYQATNPNAQYIQAGPGAWANGGRNTLPGRPINNLDFSLMKNIRTSERIRVQLSAQFFNLLNHPQFVPGYTNRADNPSVPNTSGSVFNYLTPGNAIFNNPEAVYTSNPRFAQLVLKLLF